HGGGSSHRVQGCRSLHHQLLVSFEQSLPFFRLGGGERCAQLFLLNQFPEPRLLVGGQPVVGSQLRQLFLISADVAFLLFGSSGRRIFGAVTSPLPLLQADENGDGLAIVLDVARLGVLGGAGNEFRQLSLG